MNHDDKLSIRIRHVVERLRHTQRELIEPLCRGQHGLGAYEEAYHAGGIERAIELLNESAGVPRVAPQKENP